MPLRSLGCHLCRKRKIRCDGGRPQCKRCIVHGVQCPGYRTDRPGQPEFLNDEQRPARHPSSAATPPPAAPGRYPANNPAPTQDGLAFEDDASTDFFPLTRMNVTPALRAQIRSAGMRLSLPRHHQPQERFLEVHHFGYALEVMFISTDQPAFSHALDALCLLEVGRASNDKRVTLRGSEAYGRALRCLSGVLMKPESLTDDSILAAVALLSRCEFFEEVRQNGRGWISHQSGMERLIEARGVNGMNSRLALLFYFFSRSGAITRSILLRKQDFYATSRWRLVGLDPPMDDYCETYILGMRQAELFERHDALDWHDPDLNSKFDTLLVAYAQLKFDLGQLMSKLRARIISDATSCPQLDSIQNFVAFSNLTSDRTLTKAFKFPSYMAGFIHSQFWLRRFLLESDLEALLLERRRFDPTWSTLFTWPKRKELLCYVISMCRCVPYLVEPANATAGEICCLLPLYTSGKYFETHHHLRWQQWVQKVQRGLSYTQGIVIPEIQNVRMLEDQRDEALQEVDLEQIVDDVRSPLDYLFLEPHS